MMGACIRGGGHIFFAGNGGSAADAQHFAAEFVSRFLFDRPGLSASSLSTDTSILTAIGNDYGFEKIFSRQLQAKAKKGDIFFAISTSGKSQNILHGLEFCESNKISSIVLMGAEHNERIIADCIISVPSTSTPRIQESHLMIGHILCEMIENLVFNAQI